MSNWSNYGWETVPQKQIKIMPIYETQYRSCPKCLSNNTFPILNMYGSPLQCSDCNNSGFEQRIIGYKNVTYG